MVRNCVKATCLARWSSFHWESHVSVAMSAFYSRLSVRLSREALFKLLLGEHRLGSLLSGSSRGMYGLLLTSLFLVLCLILVPCYVRLPQIFFPLEVILCHVIVGNWRRIWHQIFKNIFLVDISIYLYVVNGKPIVLEWGDIIEGAKSFRRTVGGIPSISGRIIF